MSHSELNKELEEIEGAKRVISPQAGLGVKADKVVNHQQEYWL
ncbi:hypothetical protein HMPREF2531_04465 [Bacteroides intestinalis]|uniref:Uncharacterized protein n=1 Tax=Bacteroides intestinalis TaxID=329854 RepID=A0A139KUD6_9BACE|nr:hypothetical protein HMPREF2531_04465 [Bacteroides intestinalis]